MTIFLLVIRIALAVIFVTAAVGKLLDREGARQAMRDFGVPGRFAPPAALLLPVAELVAAVALVPPLTGWFGAIGALLLLGAFSAAIALSIARGQAPDCHCFGQLGGGPVGISTLARNAGFSALAIVAIAAGPDQDGYGWITDLTRLEQATLGLGGIAIAFSIAVLGLVMLLLTRLLAYRRRIEILERDMPKPGLPVGDPAPTFVLPAVSALAVGANGASAASSNGASGQPSTTEAEATLDELRAPGLPVLLAFTSPTCAPCKEFYPELAEWQRDHADALTVAVIGTGDAAENRERSDEHALSNFLVQHELEVSSSYRAQGTPTAVLVTAEGAIASPLARGADEIRDLTAALRHLSSIRATPSGSS